ncbi:RNA polymerase sigma-70 factor [Mangrovibacterium diazotrophicum]|uniref:RNA polymerase sigma-70 factor (ECF subfamily) n=1 Tax=Mangrovibacterium diazotrophicum TaxID=1261403 RepID=A0A419W652_9BACT|nr:RNA polymerase sigma-70 factor [Mangrovibacterium diazotrophicum]RKD90916.1 RNA polymerase sigma-70 factor (ECF subfamily) [Mangrovibacterium diazotrophicum]
MEKTPSYRSDEITTFLWHQIQNGDKEAFEIFFKGNYLKFCAFANQYTQNVDDAREVVQELFIYLWEHQQRLSEVKSIKTYIFSAIRYNSIRKRKASREKTLEISDVPEEEVMVDFQSELEYAQLQEQILEAIDSLPPQCQRIFKMSRFERMTYKQIAEVLNISPKTVEVQISKALRGLQKSFDSNLLGLVILLMTKK